MYSYGTDQFLYPAWKPGFGKFIGLGFFYEFAPGRKHPEGRLSIGIQHILGNVMADYEIRYGVGTNYDQYVAEHFFRNYIINRLQLTFGVTLDVWQAGFGPVEKR